MMRDRQILPNDASATDGVVMYETNFGFHRQPFQCADLARAFFVSESIRSILPQLLHAMRSDLGIAVLTGPPGVGKTSFLKHLQFQLKHEGRAIMCSGASLETPTEVLQMLQSASQLRAGELSSELPAAQPVPTRWTVIEQMRKTREFWGPILLFIDDAQLLSVPVLNELRAFTEEEWNGRGLVRCLISGPLSLEEELARPAQADFSHRIRCHAFLQPLSSRESIELLSRHLDVVGGRLREVFSARALELIATAADGLPRCLSLLADESLVVAAEHANKVADETCVRKALARLQQLAYAWNASPLPSDADSSSMKNEPVSTSVTQPAAAPGTSMFDRASAIVEIGSPGVIEIGGNSRTSSPASPLSNTKVVATAITPTQITPTATEKKTADLEFGFSSTAKHLFEVGHRYQPDALEAVDVVEMDNFEHDPNFSTTSEQRMLPTSDRPQTNLPQHPQLPAATVDQAVANERTAAMDDESRSPVRRHNGGFAQPLSAERKTPQVYFLNGDDSVKNSKDRDSENSVPTPLANTSNIAEQPSLELAAEMLSSRIPIFDRYTWLSLGRDVPAGNYNVSSASEMHRVTNSFPGTNLVFHHSAQQSAFPTTFDEVPIFDASDSEILASLRDSVSAIDRGTFLLHQSTATSTSAASSLADDMLHSPFMNDHIPEPPVGVELFNPTERFSEISDTSSSENRDSEAAATFSEFDRQFIRDAIRSKLSQYLPGTQPANTTDGAETVSAGTDSAMPGDAVPHDGTRVAAEWHDGQLLFDHANSDALTEAISKRVLSRLSASATDGDNFSLSFEAARVARDENLTHASAERDTPPEERLPDKFFTLPVNPRTIEWDLRSSMLVGEDIRPLADSLASLRDEVNSFQQTGWSEVPDAQNNVSIANLAAVADVPMESLVSMARRRLDQTDTERHRSQETPTSTVLNAAAEAASFRTAATVAPEVKPSAKVSNGDQETASADISSAGGPGTAFSQLFTRLRKIRTQSAENR